LQAQGSLAQTPLKSLLETAQGERSTGTLTLRSGSGESTSLYFVFGHLFHAQGERTAGDDAVVNALNWPRGEFEFDARAKLPADETVKASIPELVRIAETAPKPSPSPEPPKVEKTEARMERREQAEAEKKVEAPQPRRGVKHRSQPKPGREPIPMPAGQVIYDSLQTSFIDFGRLITNLEKEAYTGYVRLLTEEAAGLILFREGSTLECMYQGGDDPMVMLGKPALQQFNDDVTRGDGVLDVVGLSAELIDGLYALAVSKPMYTDLYAAWVDMRALLKFLHERRLSGSVMIRAKAGTGVIILAEGELAGAYTSESREIADEPDRALALCEDPNATIEVKSAESTQHPPLDVEEAVAAPPAVWNARPPQEAAAGPPPRPPAPPAQKQGTTALVLPVVPPETPPAPATTASYLAIPQGTGALPAPPTVPVPSSTPPLPAGPLPDWAALVAELQAMAGDSLGHRARKVKELLGNADPSLAGIEAAIDQVPYLSILFVDSSRLEQLAQDMGARLNPHS
jgi:hypothetical protein